jgi:DNA-directed RNA polymerase beta' subunit
MTARGGIMAINRHGINRTDESPLKKCTFEETVDMLLDAGKDAVYDDLNAVSSNIIVGKTAKLGTGMFDLNWDNTYNRRESEQKSATKYKKMEHEERKQRRKTVVISPVRENRYVEGQYTPAPTLEVQSEPILEQLDNFEYQEPVDTQSLFSDLTDMFGN